MQVGELFASFSLDTSGFAKAVMNIESEIGRMSAGLAAAGAGLETYLTAPLARFSENALQAGMAFSAQMSTVEAVSGAAGESLEALRQAALDAGSETSFTASEAGKALEYMAMAGWRTEDMLSGLRPIMDLAAASGADLAKASDIVTDAMTAMGYRADETYQVIRDGAAIDTGISNVRHFADVLAAVSANANTNVEMLGESFKFAAPLAGALGYSVEDVAVTLGLMANQGIKASQAGTTLRSLFKRLADPPKAARAAMEEYGISLTDTAGNMRSLSSVVNELRAASERMTETEKAAFASAIAGTTGMSGFLALLNAAPEDVDQLRTAIENCSNATEEMAGTRLRNASGAITILKSAVEGLEITLFSFVEGAVMNVAAGLTDLVNAFRTADPFVQQATMAFLGLGAAIGPALKGFSLLLPFLGGMLTPLGILTAGAGVFALTFLDYATAAGPAMDEAGNAVARSAGRIQTAVRNMSTQALPKLRHFTATAVSYIGSVAESMPGMTEALKSAVDTLLPDVMEMLLTLPAAFLSGISVSLDGLADLAGSMISALIRGIGQALPALVRAAADACSAMLAAFTDTARIRAFGESVMHDLTNALSSADFRKAAEQLGDALLGAAGNIRQILSGITGYLSGIDLSHIGQQLQDGIRVALQGIEAVLLGSEHVSEPAWRAIGAKLNQFIREGFAGAGTWLRQLILGDSLEGGTWRDAGSRIAGWIRSGLTLGRDFLTGLILGDADNQAAFADLGMRIISGIRSGLDTGAGMLRQVLLEGTEEGTWEAAGRQMAAYLRAGITSLGSLLKEAVGSPEELNLQALGEQIGNGLRAGLETLRGFLAELIMSGADGTRSWLELGGQIGLAIRSGISEAGNFLSGLILGGESGNSWTDTGKRIAEQIREGFLFKAGLLESLIFGTETDWHARGKQTAALIRNGFEAAGNFLLEVLGLNGTEDWTARGHMIWQRIQAGFQDAGQFLEGLLLGDASGGSWVSAGSRIWTAVRQGLSEAEGYLMTCLFGRAGEPDWRALGARAADGLSAGLEGLRGLLSQLLMPEMEAGGSWADIGRTLFEGILDGMKRAADAAGSFLTGLLLGESGDWEMTFQSAGSALWQMLREGFVTAMTGLGSLAGLIAESILRFDWLPAGGEIGIGLVRGILESFTALGSGIEGFLQEVFRGVKYAVLTWFGIEIDDMTRQMESRVFTLDGSRITGEALNSLIGSSSATIREQAEAWAMLVQAGFEEQANTLSFSPAAVALVTRLQTDMLGEQERILAAAALIASGFGDAILMQDFGLYADGRAMMDELYQGLEDGADVTCEMCMQLGIEVPETIAEALGDGPWNMTGEAMTEGMNRALEQVNAEAEALAAAYGRDTGNAYIEEVNAALESAVLSSDGLSSALLEAAGDAAQAGGDTIGRQVMDAAGAAVRENRDVLSREAALAAEPAAFETARENAGEAGASIGGAIAPEITARLADVEGAVAQLVDAIGAGFFPVGDRMAEGMHGAMARVLEEMDSGAEMIQARLNALDLQFSASMEPLGTVLGAGAGGTVSVDMRRTDIPDGALLADSLTGGFGKLSGMLTAILETELAALAGVLDAGCLALLQGAAEYAGQMQTLHAELSEQIISVTETLSGTLRDLFSAFHAEMTSQMRTFVSELTAEYAPVQERLREITERMSSDVRAVFMDFSSALTMQMQALTDMLQSVFSVLPSALSAIMQSAMSAVQAAIEAGGSMAAAAASSAAAGIISAMQAHAGYGQGYGIGQNLMEGVAGGIRGMAGQLASAAASAVSKAVTVMRQTLKIHSPSKVTMEIGENMDAGVALGIAGGQMIEAAGASVRAAALKMADAAYIEMPEREMTVTARTAPEMVKAGDGEETDREARSIALAEQVAVILADRLIESGALCGDFYLDSTKVGQQVAGPVSRCISDRSRSTVRGRSASGILT